MSNVADRVAGAYPALTSFVGRRTELAALRALLGDGRLVTITGPGGSGKTRLAEELAGQIARSFWTTAFAYLAGAEDATGVGHLVAASVGLRGSEEPVTALIEYLDERRCLLVLDNCEHVQAAAAELAGRILSACPGVVVIATSRRPLLVPGEQLFPIGGLAEEAAIALFTDRVRLASPSFVLGPQQLATASRLCARLDDMPLAIELAAARVRYLGLNELETRITGHLTDLGSPGSAAPARQRTLRATIDWSHDLLDGEERLLWRRLCIFVGGFTLSSAETVAGAPPLHAADLERILGELVDRSMVAFDPAEDRYRVIEAMREYGLEHLREAGEEQAIAARHRDWVLARAEDVFGRWWGAEQARLLDGLSADAGNLRAALDSCRTAGDLETGLRIATASIWFWLTRASHAEAAERFQPFLGGSSNSAFTARAYLAVGWLAVLSGRLEQAHGYLDTAVPFVRQSADPSIDAYFSIVTALVLISEGRQDEPLRLARAVRDDPTVDGILRSWAFVSIGILSYLAADYEAAADVARQALAACRAVGESWTQVIHLHLLAVARWRLGEAAAAKDLLIEALWIDRRLDDVWHRAWTIEGLGWLAADLGRDERAARLLGIAARCWAFAGTTLTNPWQIHHDTAEAQLRRRMGDRRFKQEFEIGHELDQARALSFALEERVAQPSTEVASARVSPRELEVAALVAEGLGNRKIGERLFLSPRTVETHVQHLMDKLGVGTRAEIAAWHAREVIGRPTG